MKVHQQTVQKMLSADEAALASHTQVGLKILTIRLTYACKEFCLTVNLQKTNLIGQDTSNIICISIGDYIQDMIT